MATVKLCAYSRAFYPFVWGYKVKLVIGSFIIIENGKIIKRSFRECSDYFLEDHAESEAFAKGLEWIVAHVDDLRDTNLQVFFCGAARMKIKSRIDNGTYFPDLEHLDFEVEPGAFAGNELLLKMFNKVTYHTAARVTIHDGEDDDPEKAEMFDIYSAVNKYFTLLYGDDINFGHKIIETAKENGKPVKRLIGLPELRWDSAHRITAWT